MEHIRLFLYHVHRNLLADPASGVPRGVWGFQIPHEILKALQNRAKLNPIVKTVKNC